MRPRFSHQMRERVAELEGNLPDVPTFRQSGAMTDTRKTHTTLGDKKEDALCFGQASALSFVVIQITWYLRLQFSNLFYCHSWSPLKRVDTIGLAPYLVRQLAFCEISRQRWRAKAAP